MPARLVGQQDDAVADRGLGGGAQISSRIDASEPGTLDQRVEQRRDFSAAQGLAAVMIFAADHGPRGVRSACLFDSGARGSMMKCSSCFQLLVMNSIAARSKLPGSAR